MKYRAYNIIIDSPIDLHPLHEAGVEEFADVTIKRGDVCSEGIREARTSHAFAQVGEDAVWLDVKSVGRFLIENGATITVDPYPDSDDDTLRLYLLGSGLGAILHQRGNLVLHANAIRVGDGVVLFAGVSGAGKSTTAAVFHQKGFRVIADDVVAIDQNELVIGGFPQIKLWEDALHHLEIEKEGLSVIRHQVKKFSYPIAHYSDEHLPVKAVYFLAARNEHEKDVFEFEPLEGMAKFNHLKAHTYRRNFMEGLGLKPSHLQLCGKIAQDIVAARITRPSHEFNAVQLADRVLEHLRDSGIAVDPETP